jgi:hypothetical protein
MMPAARLETVEVGGTKGKVLTTSVAQIYSDFTGAYILYCIMLYYAYILYCIMLYYAYILYCIMLYYAYILYCIMLYYAYILYCIMSY